MKDYQLITNSKCIFVLEMAIRYGHGKLIQATEIDVIALQAMTLMSSALGLNRYQSWFQNR